tara:strand:+ start:41 stop:523 length:483 start_codon:yes stop_codon:yes gene_type:complete
MKPPEEQVLIPARTYISVPFTLMKLGLKWKFIDQKWQDFYPLINTNIIDAAVHFQKGGYVANSLMCLSFQYKKTLSLGRGGAILCETKNDYDVLKKMSYDGRSDDKPWRQQDISTMGYHYYMTPETAALGSKKLQSAVLKERQGSENYPYLPDMKIFNLK